MARDTLGFAVPDKTPTWVTDDHVRHARAIRGVKFTRAGPGRNLICLQALERPEKQRLWAQLKQTGRAAQVADIMADPFVREVLDSFKGSGVLIDRAGLIKGNGGDQCHPRMS